MFRCLLASLVTACALKAPPAETTGTKTTPSFEKYHWSYVPFETPENPQSVADRPTGYGVRLGSGEADQCLVIFMEGGGACFDEASCAFSIEPWEVEVMFGARYQLAKLDAFQLQWERFDEATLQDSARSKLARGLFDRGMRNPFRHADFVFIPYMHNSDIYAGANTKRKVGDQTYFFQGYEQTRALLEHVIDLLGPEGLGRGRSCILFGGASAGGIGAWVHTPHMYELVQNYTKHFSVFNLGGPLLENEYMPICLQNKWKRLWGLNSSIGKACHGCFAAGEMTSNDDAGLFELLPYLLRRYPQVRFGLATGIFDRVMSTFYSPSKLGTNGSCAMEEGMFLRMYSHRRDRSHPYTRGLRSLQKRLHSFSNFRTFFTNDKRHLNYASTLWFLPDFDMGAFDAVVDDQSAVDWLYQMVTAADSKPGRESRWKNMQPDGLWEGVQP